VTDIYKKCDTFLNFCNNFAGKKESDNTDNNKMLLDSSDEEDSFEKEMNNYLKFTKNDDALEEGDDLEGTRFFITKTSNQQQEKNHQEVPSQDQ
jgi:hypothetical protein